MVQVVQVNPFIASLREKVLAATAQELAENNKTDDFEAAQLDLELQMAIVVCSYPPDAFLEGRRTDIREISKELKELLPGDALKMLTHAVQTGRVKFKPGFFKKMGFEQLERLADIYESARSQAPADINWASYFKDMFPESASLANFQLQNVRERRDIPLGKATLRPSNKTVWFKPIDLGLSAYYSHTHHYIHAPRAHDTIAFGMFLEGYDWPFGVASFAPVRRPYKRKVIEAAGFNPDQALELTRAWNCKGSPQNAIGMLYAYSKRILNRNGTELVGGPVKVIPSDINRNLFDGAAYKASGFTAAGEKDTLYYFTERDDGRREFLTSSNVGEQHQSGKEILLPALPLEKTNILTVPVSGPRGKNQTVISIPRHEVIEDEVDPSFRALA